MLTICSQCDSEIILCGWDSPSIKLIDSRIAPRRTPDDDHATTWEWWLLDRRSSDFAFTPHPLVKPIWSTYMTFDDPSLHSVDGARANVVNGSYSIGAISKADLSRFRNTASKVIQRKGRGSGLYWQLITKMIQNRGLGPLMDI